MFQCDVPNACIARINVFILFLCAPSHSHTDTKPLPLSLTTTTMMKDNCLLSERKKFKLAIYMRFGPTETLRDILL
jgi:hypothetical protein